MLPTWPPTIFWNYTPSSSPSSGPFITFFLHHTTALHCLYCGPGFKHMNLACVFLLLGVLPLPPAPHSSQMTLGSILALLWLAVWLHQLLPFPTHSVLHCVKFLELGSMQVPSGLLAFSYLPLSITFTSSWPTYNISPWYVQILTSLRDLKVKDRAFHLSYHWPTYVICQSAVSQSDLLSLSV